ncbi:MAG: type II toxin-antitoxin system HicA family toxin [Oscillospiraceae bacterium]|nr:type II toxin-antitoxin system HicA family toxin [Oscillospiraceae bacterium]MBQ4315661.1 type II toxin-antitoxin system HicA family toxin [Oscillospiraceae bacterium]MBQ6697561.1 type II toxin-antitoxin system HicA family toxin [Oscillospiraceae bacterium]
MPPIEKILNKMKNQPNGIRISEIDKVLTHYGYRLDRQRGSHRQYINKNGDVITIKDESPAKAVYVKDVLNRIKNLPIE